MSKLKNLKPTIGTLAPRLLPPPKIADSFYTSLEWRALISEIKRERGSRCEVPGCRSTHRVIGDHVIEISDGGAKLDKHNILLLCIVCHNRKTQMARALRARNQALTSTSIITALAEMVAQKIMKKVEER